jgi:hypothetical protein
LYEYRKSPYDISVNLGDPSLLAIDLKSNIPWPGISQAHVTPSYPVGIVHGP